MNIPKRLKIYDQAILFSFYPLIFFLPISTALVELCSTIILSGFFLKQWLLLELKNKKSYPFPVPFWQRIVLNIVEFFRPESGPLNIPLGIFILVNLLSVIFSPYLWISFKGFVCKLVEGVYLYFAFVSVMKTASRARWFIFIFLCSIAVVTVNGLVQYFTGQGFIFGHLVGQGGRIASSFKQANDFGSYLLIASFLLFGLFLEYFPFRGSDKKKGRDNAEQFLFPIVILLLVLSLFCLGLTLSRGAWVGFFLGLIVLAWLYKRFFYVPIFVGVFFIGIFFPIMQLGRNVSFKSDDVKQEARMEKDLEQAGRYQNAPGQESKSALAFNALSESQLEEKSTALWLKSMGMGRYTFWKEALHIIREFPILGVGINTYSSIAPEYKLTWGGYPHNCYLQMAAETGVLGLLAFFVVLWRLFRHARRAFSAQAEKFSHAILGGMLPGLFAFLVHSFVDTNFYSVQLGVLMWVAMAALISFSQEKISASALAEIYFSSPSFDFAFLKTIQTRYLSFRNLPIASRVKIILLIISGVLILSYINHSNSNLKYSKVYCSLGEENLEKGHINKAKKYFKRAIEINPASARAYFGLGTTYRENKQNDKATMFFLKTLELDPQFHAALNGLGLVQQSLGEYAQAINYFGQAIHCSGNYRELPLYHYNLGVTYLLMGDRVNALREVEYIRNVDDPVMAEKLKQYIANH